MSTTLSDPAAQAKQYLAQIEAEEKELLLLHFDGETAFELGQSIRSAYLGQYQHPTSSSAADKASGIVISIQTVSGNVLFACAAGHPLATSQDNWNWVQRKTETVKRFGRASFLVGQKRAAAGKAIDHGLDTSVYAAHGGAVPIRMAQNQIGPVAIAVVSGLKQEDDHRLVVDALRKIIKKQQIQASHGGGAIRDNVPLPLVKKQLIVFDFDWSLADQDTDRWVHESLAPQLRKRMKSLMSQVQFTDLCSQMLRELHALGATPEQIKAAMRNLPFHPGMIRGVKALKDSPHNETTFFLLSNSNTVYIDTILEHHGLKPIFTEIVTNPARFLENGLLELKRRVPPPGQPGTREHGCKIGCSANMCKGEELDAFLERHGGRKAFDRIIYVGDGGNDYCPVLRLGEKDVALVRQYRGLEKRIRTEAAPKAGIRWWAGAWEMELLLKNLGGVPVPDA